MSRLWIVLNLVVPETLRRGLLSTALSGGISVCGCPAQATPRGSGHSFFFLCWLPHFSKHQKRKQFLKRYLHKENHRIQCFCTLCYVAVQFCALLHSLLTGLLCIVNMSSMERLNACVQIVRSSPDLLCIL